MAFPARHGVPEQLPAERVPQPRMFGTSAPLKQLLRTFGFFRERVTQIATEQVAASTWPPGAASPAVGKEAGQLDWVSRVYWAFGVRFEGEPS
jgi:hypothetical protein